MLIANGHSGEIGILAGHTPLITLLKPGPMRMKSADGSSEEVVYVSGGVLEVQPHVVTVLADSAERAYDLDEAKLPKLVAMPSRLWQNQSANIDTTAALTALAESISTVTNHSKYKNRA